jgi:NADPH-dependent ferric siderophore reductase
MQPVQVTRVVQLTPHMVRVTFTGDQLGAFVWNGPAAHIKLAFPEEGQTEIPVPDPEGPRPTRMRTYTPLRFDPALPELDVDFVLHGDGPASSWAAQARPGQMALLSGPGPSYPVAPDADWFLLAGDDAALPAIETILTALPAGVPVRAIVEVIDRHEERALPTPARLDVTWVDRGPDPARADAALEAAIAAIPLPPGNGRIYVGCEAAAMRRIRTHLLHERGVDPATLVTRGYWRLGATNYTDRDYGTDDLPA